MITNKMVRNSVYFSLAVQIITSIVQIYGLFLVLPEKDSVLQDVLTLETVVQFIEAVFYSWLAYGIYQMKDVTPRRYYDWFLTTPTMLLATVIYFKYLEGNHFTIGDFIKENKINIIKLFGFNWLMLLFGYLGETNKMPLLISVFIGFIFFILSFYTIYSQYVTTTEALYLFNFLFVVWGLYGVVAFLSTNLKNFLYNILDIISKNFYGLYIFYKILLISY